MSDALLAGSSGRWDPDASGAPSTDVVEIVTSLREGSRVLDAGCGAGRNALFAASLGQRVDAFDLSSDAVRETKQRANLAELRLNVTQLDLARFRAEPEYDVVICHGVLHFLEPAAARDAVGALQGATKPGGVVLISVFDERLPIPEDLRDAVNTVFGEGELRRLFAGWTITHSLAYVLEDEHEGGLVRHRHSIDRLRARKP